MTEQTNDKQVEIEASTFVAPSPHLQDTSFTTRRMMTDVLIGLAPLMIVALVVFRQYAVLQVASCVVGCIAAEVLFSLMRKRKPTIGDCSAIVTGIILAFSIPWNTPIYVSLIGSFVAIGIGKIIFGGLGMNLFNPAMVGRAFIMLAFAGALGAPAYVKGLDKMPWLESVGATPAKYAAVTPEGMQADAVSAATPMTAAKEYRDSGGKKGFVPGLMQLFLGNTVGSLGETSALAAILGGLWLIFRRTISWEIPLGIIAAVILISGGRQLMYPVEHWTVLHSLCGGALLFGAFFIATDPVTSPMTMKGKLIFGLGMGATIEIIRLLSGYPEGVMFAVLLMNAVVPLINRWCVPKPFGVK